MMARHSPAVQLMVQDLQNGYLLIVYGSSRSVCMTRDCDTHTLYVDLF